jgi:hypothetical protein
MDTGDIQSGIVEYMQDMAQYEDQKAQKEQGAQDKEQGDQGAHVQNKAQEEQGVQKDKAQAVYNGADLSHIHVLTGHLLDLSDPLVSRYLDDEPCLLAPWVQVLIAVQAYKHIRSIAHVIYMYRYLMSRVC